VRDYSFRRRPVVHDFLFLQQFTHALKLADLLFNLLIQAREILDGRGTKDDVARALGVHPFVAEKAAQQAARFSIESLEAIYHRLLNIDESVKTSQMTLDLAMDTLVVELTR